MTRETWRSSAMSERSDIGISGLAPCLRLLGLDGAAARE